MPPHGRGKADCPPCCFHMCSLEDVIGRFLPPGLTAQAFSSPLANATFAIHLFVAIEVLSLLEETFHAPHGTLSCNVSFSRIKPPTKKLFFFFFFFLFFGVFFFFFFFFFSPLVDSLPPPPPPLSKSWHEDFF